MHIQDLDNSAHSDFSGENSAQSAHFKLGHLPYPRNLDLCSFDPSTPPLVINYERSLTHFL